MIKKIRGGGVVIYNLTNPNKKSKREGDYGNIIHFSRKIGGVA